ncbi:rho GTPase-activating protein gacZ [Aplysia californica]|uniref:Rho GTPase-activating protein gacZ n=1 Tax=Aplysia californica TaxID=6500 RepID=A0ABM0K2H8_APLCA|nr:rho GTPase-activating protein gacZ [Aplysia californica]
MRDCWRSFRSGRQEKTWEGQVIILFCFGFASIHGATTYIPGINAQSNSPTSVDVTWVLPEGVKPIVCHIFISPTENKDNFISQHIVEDQSEGHFVLNYLDPGQKYHVFLSCQLKRGTVNAHVPVTTISNGDEELERIGRLRTNTSEQLSKQATSRENAHSSPRRESSQNEGSKTRNLKTTELPPSSNSENGSLSSSQRAPSKFVYSTKSPSIRQERRTSSPGQDHRPRPSKRRLPIRNRNNPTDTRTQLPTSESRHYDRVIYHTTYPPMKVRNSRKLTDSYRKTFITPPTPDPIAGRWTSQPGDGNGQEVEEESQHKLWQWVAIGCGSGIGSILLVSGLLFLVKSVVKTERKRRKSQVKTDNPGSPSSVVAEPPSGEREYVRWDNPPLTAQNNLAVPGRGKVADSVYSWGSEFDVLDAPENPYGNCDSLGIPTLTVTSDKESPSPPPPRRPPRTYQKFASASNALFRNVFGKIRNSAHYFNRDSTGSNVQETYQPNSAIAAAAAPTYGTENYRYGNGSSQTNHNYNNNSNNYSNNHSNSNYNNNNNSNYNNNNNNNLSLNIPVPVSGSSSNNQQAYRNVPVYDQEENLYVN